MKFAVTLMAIAAVASPALAAKKVKPLKVAPIGTIAVAAEPAATPDNLWHLDLSTGGSVVIQLRPDKAPAHVERIRLLTRAGFYDGLLFHRVIEGFMAQTGDPKGTGEGGSPLPDLKAESNDLPHVRGTASMARAELPDSANSQFFITLMPVLRLDKKYTALGRVVSGMNFVDAVPRGEPPTAPAKVVRAWIEADGPNAPRVALVVPTAVAPVAEATPEATVAAPVAPAPVAAAKPADVKKRKKVLGLF